MHEHICVHAAGFFLSWISVIAAIAFLVAVFLQLLQVSRNIAGAIIDTDFATCIPASFSVVVTPCAMVLHSHSRP